jgi:DNA (cytosine-5)-methyltransferase 1
LIKGVSLFANVGIAETYLANQDVEICVANELLRERVEFYNELYPECHMIQGDITTQHTYKKVLQTAQKENCDFLLATPPCQGMSVAGQMQEDDPRNSLIKYVVKMIQDLSPSFAIIENVPMILKTYLLHKGEKIKLVDFILNELPEYKINYKIVNTADYATPQTRKRAIFLLSKHKKWEFPEPQKHISLKTAIGSLPSLNAGENSHIAYHKAKKHNARHILCMQHTPSGKTALQNEEFYPKKEDGTKIKGYRSTYRRMAWDKPAPTITMSNGSIASHTNVHPGRKLPDGTYSDARVLTLKEIFVLTGLPQDWTPPTWASEHFVRQVIGEGVPPRLIENLLATMPRN